MKLRLKLRKRWKRWKRKINKIEVMNEKIYQEEISSYPKDLRYWLENIESNPLFRNCKQYPEDWNYRTWFVRLRDNNTCQKCKRRVDDTLLNKDQFHTHHIISLKNDGDNSLNNLVYICKKCHQKHHPHMIWKSDNEEF